MSEQNKLVKMVTDSAVLVGLTAGVGYLAKKILKENFLGDPSSNVMNYAKFTGVLAGSMALKTYLPHLLEVLTWRNIYQEQKLIKNGGDMIKLWRNTRGTTRNIRKIGKSY